MTKHYTCDRCALPIHSTRATILTPDVLTLVDTRTWEGSPASPPPALTVSLGVTLPANDDDRPELCVACTTALAVRAALALRVADVFQTAITAHPDLFGCSLLDLCADQTHAPLVDLKQAILDANLTVHPLCNDRLRAQIESYR